MIELTGVKGPVWINPKHVIMFAPIDNWALKGTELTLVSGETIGVKEDSSEVLKLFTDNVSN